MTASEQLENEKAEGAAWIRENGPHDYNGPLSQQAEPESRAEPGWEDERPCRACHSWSTRRDDQTMIDYFVGKERHCHVYPR